MSYSQFYCTAKCTVADDFKLNEYIVSLADFIANHIDDDALETCLVHEFDDCTHEEVCEKISEYFNVIGNQLFITVDSEENNTEIHEWLMDQVVSDAMVSNAMEINAATISSRTGCKCGTFFLMKDGTFVGSDEIHAIVEKSFPQINS